jgi:hypothetical protein
MLSKVDLRLAPPHLQNQVGHGRLDMPAVQTCASMRQVLHCCDADD